MSRKKADLLLAVVTLFWGSSYLFMKTGLESISAFNLNALRFLLAFLVTGCLFYRHLIHADRRTWFYSGVLGILLFGVFTTVAQGVRMTTTSNAGFLVSLTVIFVPLLSAALFHTRIGIKMWLAVFLALTGIGFLTLSHFAVTIGDFYCMLCALFNALYIIAANHFTKKVDAVGIGVLQLGFTGVLSAVCSFLIETPQLPQTGKSWISVLGLGILCSAVGYMVQIIAQKYTTSGHAGLIFTLEPVFAAIFAFLFVGERLTVNGLIGAALVLISVFIPEIHVRKTQPVLSAQAQIK